MLRLPECPAEPCSKICQFNWALLDVTKITNYHQTLVKQTNLRLVWTPSSSCQLRKVKTGGYGFIYVPDGQSTYDRPVFCVCVGGREKEKQQRQSWKKVQVQVGQRHNLRHSKTVTKGWLAERKNLGILFIENILEAGVCVRAHLRIYLMFCHNVKESDKKLLNLHQNIMASLLAHVPSFQQVAWNQFSNCCAILLTNKQQTEVIT